MSRTNRQQYHPDVKPITIKNEFNNGTLSQEHKIRKTLGSGGVGGVYSAMLSGFEKPVAIKRISFNSCQLQNISTCSDQYNLVSKLAYAEAAACKIAYNIGANTQTLWNSNKITHNNRSVKYTYTAHILVDTNFEEGYKELCYFAKRKDIYYLSEKIQLCHEVAKAIHQLHQRQFKYNGKTYSFVHNDLKLGNILVKRDNGHWKIKIIDFVASNAVEMIANIKTHTKEYTPPEYPHRTQASDWFSAALIFAFLLGISKFGYRRFQKAHNGYSSRNIMNTPYNFVAIPGWIEHEKQKLLGKQYPNKFFNELPKLLTQLGSMNPSERPSGDKVAAFFAKYAKPQLQPCPKEYKHHSIGQTLGIILEEKRSISGQSQPSSSARQTLSAVPEEKESVSAQRKPHSITIESNSSHTLTPKTQSSEIQPKAKPIKHTKTCPKSCLLIILGFLFGAAGALTLHFGVGAFFIGLSYACFGASGVSFGTGVYLQCGKPSLFAKAPSDKLDKNEDWNFSYTEVSHAL